MRNNVRWVLVSVMVVSAMLAGGCSDSPTVPAAPSPEKGTGIAHVYASSNTAISGGQAKFSIENHGAEELTYSPCVDYVEHKVGAQWIKADAFEVTMNAIVNCSASRTALPTNSIILTSITLKIPKNTEEGSYHIVMESVYPTNQIQRLGYVVVSDVFSVVRGSI